MTETGPGLIDEQVALDGRVARRQRNIDAVLDVVLTMFAEDSLFPSMEQVAQRSGLSLRSLYRYFADPEALHDAAVRHHRARIEPIAHLPAIGQGPLERRIEALVSMRLAVYEEAGPAFRATLHNAGRNARVRDQLARARDDLRAQFERQFAPELRGLRSVERDAVVAAGDVLTQLDSIEVLRRHRQLSVPEVEAALRAGLTALLGGSAGE